MDKVTVISHRFDSQREITFEIEPWEVVNSRKVFTNMGELLLEKYIQTVCIQPNQPNDL